jgi:dihydrofolate synthase/folylpolyglutamate synthase
LYFKEEKVDYVIIECGLGARLDATGILKKPECCAITSIGYDHMDILGSSLDEIAFEKAGVIKDDVPIVLGPTVT